VSVALNRNLLESDDDPIVRCAFDMLLQLQNRKRGIEEEGIQVKAASGSMMETIAHELRVPILLAALRDHNNVMQYFSYGINIETDCCHLAVISDTLCQNGMQILPDYRKNPDLAMFKGRCLADRARFYVGIPIKDKCGSVIGSLAILQESRLIATLGFSLEKMQEQSKRMIGYVRDKARLAQYV
jgi:hypothetical protein